MHFFMRKRHLFSVVKRTFFASLLSLPFCSCSDSVDDSNLYTFTGEVITDYLKRTEDVSSFNFILTKAKLSDYSESTLSELLSTRGNYTCFVPTNEAIQIYLDSIYNTTGYDLNQIPDSTAIDIAKNSIIDNGDAAAYMAADLTEGSLEKTSMADRFVTINLGNDPTTNRSVITVNSSSRIIQSDIDVSNGVIHKLDRVMAPSNATLPALIGKTKNLNIFSLLLKETGWDEQMVKYRDLEYEAYYAKNPTGKDLNGSTAKAPEHRNYGYTAFVETDSLFFEKWNIPLPVLQNGIIQNSSQILSALREKCAQAYPNATSNDSKSPDNALNQFVAYHLLPMRIAFDKLVIHYAEMGFSYNSPENLTINCFEYYETMGLGDERRLLKITEGGYTSGKRINRHSTYNTEDYTETNVDRVGLKISNYNSGYTFNALNGYYYTIDDILIYDEDVPNKVLNERLRFDISSLLPEMMTNGFRRPNDGAYFFIPNGYFDNIKVNSNTTRYSYLPGYGSGWPDFQGDEHNIVGQYDFTIKLPPVPFEGTYEIRWAIPTFDSRGMAQFYIGKNKENLPAVGLPVDLRLRPSNPSIGWVSDFLSDGTKKSDDEITENEKAMRNHGYMNPPLHDGMTSGGKVTTSLRYYATSDYLRVRRIIYTGTMKPTETWYLRVKSVLKSTSTQFVMDWMELVPKNIYNGVEPEDRW